VGLLLFLTFFSRSLMDLGVPRVSLAFIERGTIQPVAMSSGLVTPSETERIFAPVSGRITQILQQGDETNAATILLTISSDMQHLLNQLEQAEHDFAVNALATEQALSNLAYAQLRRSQLLAQPLDLPVLNLPTLELFEFDVQLNANAAGIETAEADIEVLTVLLAEGAIPRQNLVNREADLVRLLQTRAEIYARRAIAVENHEEAITRMEEQHDESTATLRRIRDEQVATQENAIRGINFSLTSQSLERERINSRLDNLRAQIEAGGVTYIYLEDRPNRRVTHIHQGLDVGSTVTEGMPVMDTAIRDHRFVIRAAFPQRQDFIRSNQNVEITVGPDTYSGTTTRVVPDGGTNWVYINVTSRNLVGGELAQVTVTADTFPAVSTIPVGALRGARTAETEYFIFYVVQQNRRFGSEYIVRRRDVRVARRDEHIVAITPLPHADPLPSTPVIVNSDTLVHDGMRVRLVSGHELAPTR